MITKEGLQEAIAECQGKRDPTANTCLKLAAYYIIKDHMYQNENVYSQSFASSKQPVQGMIVDMDTNNHNDSEFMSIVRTKDIEDTLSVIDELMNTLSIINPRLYNGVMRALAE